MRKTVSLILWLAVVCLLLGGCSHTPDANKPGTENTTHTTASETVATTAATTTAEATTTAAIATDTTSTTGTTVTTTIQKATTTTKKPTASTTTTKKPTTTTTTQPTKAVGEYAWQYNDIPNGHSFKFVYADDLLEEEIKSGYVGHWSDSLWWDMSLMDLPENFTPFSPVVTIDGVDYLNTGGDGGLFKIAIDGNVVTVTTDCGETLILERIEEKKMKVISSDVVTVPKGAIFTGK